MKYKDAFLTRWGGRLPDVAALAPAGVHLLISKNPYKTYALHPDARPAARVASSRACMKALWWVRAA